MAINSSFLGATTVSGEEAKAFTRMIVRGRARKVVTAAAQSGRKMAAQFAKKGVISLNLKTTDKK